MAYKLEFNRKADREFRRLDRVVQERLAQALEALEGDPRPRGARKLTAPGPPRYRIRVGAYRAVYSVYDDRQIVLVTLVRHRSQAYRDL